MSVCLLTCGGVGGIFGYILPQCSVVMLIGMGLFLPQWSVKILICMGILYPIAVINYQNVGVYFTPLQC